VKILLNPSENLQMKHPEIEEWMAFISGICLMLCKWLSLRLTITGFVLNSFRSDDYEKNCDFYLRW
jgi:hypothetical protein